MYKTVRDMFGGSIRIESAVGKGTEIHIYLPLADAPERREPGTLDYAGESPHTVAADADYGTVLVIDDEESVRRFVAKALTRFGYNVLTAADGSEGVEVFTEHRDGIDLVLLDMTMPRMSGGETLAKLHEIDDGVRVVVSSGKPVEDELIVDGARAFVMKPYRVTDLIDTVRQALDD